MKRSHQGHFSRSPAARRSLFGQRLAVAIGSVALCALLLLGPAVHAGSGGGKVPKAPGPSTPLSDCQQQCFDHYLSNLAGCKRALCDQFLFITISCDEAGLAMCKADAKNLFERCLVGCAWPFA